jgi:AcrR family transcriptional regulator
MRALAQRTGVSHTAPYRHFADKSALLAAVAEKGFNLLLQRLHEVEQGEDDNYLAVFQEMGVAYVLFAVEHPTHYQLMFSGDNTWKEMYPAFQAAGNAVFDLLMGSIERCQRQNLIKPGDPRDLAHVVWALVHGLSTLLINQQLTQLTDVRPMAALATQTLAEGLNKK